MKHGRIYCSLLALTLSIASLTACSHVGDQPHGTSDDVSSSTSQGDTAHSASQGDLESSDANTSQNTFEDKVYSYAAEGSGTLSITICGNGRFKSRAGKETVHNGVGTWSVDKDVLTLKDETAMEYTNRFKITDGGLEYIKADSQGFWLVSLDDGAKIGFDKAKTDEYQKSLEDKPAEGLEGKSFCSHPAPFRSYRDGSFEEYNKDYALFDTFIIHFYEDGRCNYTTGPASSYLGMGTYVFEDGIVTMTDHSFDIHNRLRYDGENLIYIKEGSTGFYGASVEDGHVFIGSGKPVFETEFDAHPVNAETLAGKLYVTDLYGSYGYTLALLEDGSAKYYKNYLKTCVGRGKWTVEGDTVTVKCDSGIEAYDRFKLIDGYLVLHPFESNGYFELTPYRAGNIYAYFADIADVKDEMQRAEEKPNIHVIGSVFSYPKEDGSYPPNYIKLFDNGVALFNDGDEPIRGTWESDGDKVTIYRHNADGTGTRAKYRFKKDGDSLIFLAKESDSFFNLTLRDGTAYSKTIPAGMHYSFPDYELLESVRDFDRYGY